MIYSKAIKQVSKDLGIPEYIVDSVYRSFWVFIRTKISGLDLKNVTCDEFDNLRTNFNIPSLGKLHCTKEEWIASKNRYKCLINLRKK